MKPLPVALLARALVWTLFALVAGAAAAFCFQCLYWLRFGSWFDWTDPDGPRFLPGGRALVVAQVAEAGELHVSQLLAALPRQALPGRLAWFHFSSRQNQQ